MCAMFRVLSSFVKYFHCHVSVFQLVIVSRVLRERVSLRTTTYHEHEQRHKRRRKIVEIGGEVIGLGKGRPLEMVSVVHIVWVAVNLPPEELHPDGAEHEVPGGTQQEPQQEGEMGVSMFINVHRECFSAEMLRG